MIFESAGPLSAHEEQALVQRLMCGDEEAVRTIYARFARPVYSLGLRLLGSAEAAEELTQDVFLTAWRKAARRAPGVAGTASPLPQRSSRRQKAIAATSQARSCPTTRRTTVGVLPFASRTSAQSRIAG